jgi:hypothetical protein
MNTPLSLKELERKAFRSTYQDGLWDLYAGLIVVSMAIFVYRPASGYNLKNIVLALISMAVAQTLFWAGKKYITLPRMGQVSFGEGRKRRRRFMVIVLGTLVVVQVALFILTLLVWMKPEWTGVARNHIPDGHAMDLTVASIGALMVGLGMVLVAFFRDFPRGYYIAILIAVAVFLMLFLNEPIYPIVIGIIIAIPGSVLFVRFLHKFPLQCEEKSNG